MVISSSLRGLTDAAVPHLVGSDAGQHASVDVPSLIQVCPFAQQPLPQQPPIVQHPLTPGQVKVVRVQLKRGLMPIVPD